MRVFLLVMETFFNIHHDYIEAEVGEHDAVITVQLENINVILNCIFGLASATNNNDISINYLLF